MREVSRVKSVSSVVGLPNPNSNSSPKADKKEVYHQTEGKRKDDEIKGRVEVSAITARIFGEEIDRLEPRQTLRTWI